MTGDPQSVVSALRTEGVAVWPQFIGRGRAAALRAEAVELLAGPHASVYPRSTRVWELYRYGDSFIDIMCDTRLLGLAGAMLGPTPLVSDLSLNQVHRGGLPDKWHIDYPFNEMPVVVTGATLGLQCILALSPFTSDTGATQYLPGTHLRFAIPPDDVPDTGGAEFLAEPGDLLLMAAATWHRAGVNVTEQPRTAILASFVESWVRPMSGPPEEGPWGRDEVARIALGMQRPPEVMALDGDVPL